MYHFETLVQTKFFILGKKIYIYRSIILNMATVFHA